MREAAGNKIRFAETFAHVHITVRTTFNEQRTNKNTQTKNGI